ncbi:MAG: hypothetical protein LC798_05530 [Chloroflexi bacterium]|nr:hypothetical protein [Chloroflexota bacterium]
MSPQRLTLTLVIAAGAVLAGCGIGGGDPPAPTYSPTAVVQCLRASGVDLEDGNPNGDIGIKTGEKRVYDKFSDPPYIEQATTARARRFVRPDLAQDALRSGPGRAWAAYAPSSGQPLAQFAGEVPGKSQVDLLFFGSPSSAKDAEPGAGDQARALDLITISGETGDATDVNKVRTALKAAGGPTAKRDGNLLTIWRTVPQPAEESTIKGCMARTLKDAKV